MPKVKVFNGNDCTLKETFKGEPVTILPKDYWRDEKGNVKHVDIYEASEFKGQYRPIPADGSGHRVDDSKYYKIIRIEPIEGEETESAPMVLHKCMAKECRFVGSDEKELSVHTATKHTGEERLVMPEEDERINKTKKPQKTA